MPKLIITDRSGKKSEIEYDSNFKVIYLLFLVILSAVIYFVISLLTKAFKLSDIKIRY